MRRRPSIGGRIDGRSITAKAGAALLGATAPAIGVIGPLAAFFRDRGKQILTEHLVKTLVTQRRVIGMALGYEDLIDHDELRDDPTTLATLSGELTAKCRWN